MWQIVQNFQQKEQNLIASSERMRSCSPFR